ncbi:VCBS domain-containing protein [Bradyrhizobium sp. RT6a]|uniref:VCBS domain-containing protein n=1 Tax=unclassified Bradyrhizobium TaxID=2631580 RepID=UPI00339B87A8
MNYAGKFDAAISLDGLGSRSPADGHVDSFTAKAHGHVPDGAFVVPDPNLIFNGDFKRAGLDLVLSHDGHDFVVHDYFRGDKRAAIASPDGAHLTGDVINALTGHVQYAQAASGIAAAQVIGHVTKLSGSATAVRNGVSVILNNGDNVEKGDVVSTGGDSTLGITFIDGTVFGLSSNARMVLNEMVYDPNGSSNSSLLSLIAGTITFVAGETAKHGDMKIDTPVATMGIRGTAVLTQINFVVPAGGGDPQPQASFQVLVEPNGTTGSYILFDKVTLLPIATVNQAGQMIQISGGNVSISNALMSPDIQKLITDVFTLKFTDNNSNTKLTQNFTDSITQTGNIVFIKTDTGATATATFTHLPEPTSPASGHDPSTSTRIPGPPVRQSLDLNGNVKTAFELIERADTTGDTTHSDTISGLITFVDQNLGDRPTVSIDLGDAPNFVYKNAGQQDVTGALSALQKQDIAATQIQISVAAAAGNNNNGSAVWTYTIPDHVFDFLAAGETLTLTYKVRVNNNFSVNPETSFIDITITITGTNDKPVITTSVPVIIFEGGTSVPGGPLTSDVPTTGTLSFDDVDLTDKHTVSVALTSATLPDGTVPPGPLAAFQSAMSVAIAAGADSTGDGTGTINWSLADLPVYLADFIPKGEVLTLVYTVTLRDAQGATSQQTITVTITGTDAPAVVWIATDKPGAPSGGFWKDAANWATGTVPTINDDVIVITDQLHGLTPSYPVTIDTAAYAKSITMNDYDTTVGHTAPEVINKSALTIAGEVSLKADSKLTNFTASTISVGGKAEFLDSSVLANAGYLTLKGGGDFASGTTITNSGTIELFGGTLTTLATIHNAGGTLKADAGTTLIVDSATVDGGTVTILGTLELDGTSLIENGTLNNSGAVNVKGTAEFAHETVSNASGGTIKVLANGWLTIDQGSTVANSGNVTVDATGKLTVNGATISGGGTVTDNGEIDLTGAAVLSGGTLNNNAAFKVSGTGNALDHETITNATTGTIEVLANGALTIDQGSTVANAGNVTVDASGKLTVNGATISGAGTVTGNGEIDLTGAAVLSGGILNNNAVFKVSGTGNALHHETITNATTGTIEVLANGALTIDQSSTVANTGNITVDANGKLTVNGATINGAGTVTGNGEIDLTGAAVLSGGTLNNNAAFKVSGTGNALDGETITNTGTIEVLANGALTIDQGSTVDNSGGNLIVDGNAALRLDDATISGGAVKGGGTIDVTGASKIDGGAILSVAAVTADAELTLDGVTVSGTVITDKSSIALDNTVKLKDGATIKGASTASKGAITNNGMLEIAGAATLLNDVLTNTGHIVKIDAGQTLTLSGTEVSGGTINNHSGTIDVTGDSKIGGNATLNQGAVTVGSGVTLTLDDTTVAGATISNGGTVKVDASKNLTLSGATIDGGTVTIAGTLESTGTSVVDSADVTNSGTISVTSGALTIDPGILHAITNHGLIEAVTGGALKLTTATVTNTGATIAVDGTSKLYLSDVSINGGSLSNLGNLYSVSGLNTITAGVTNTGAIEVQTGTLNLAGGLSGVGSVIIDDGATLELAGATAQTIAFAGGVDTLQLDKVAGQSFTGTIAGQSTKAGTFTIKGAADITTASGDALDFTASGGTSATPADIVLTPTGALTGAANGVAVTQNGTGDISFTATGDIKGLAGHGMWLRDSATGAGDITVNNLTGKATGTGANSVGVLVENLNSASAGGISITQLGGAVGGAYGIDAVTQGGGDITINAGGVITGSSIYGIRSRSYGAGDQTVTTKVGSVVTSGSSGIVAVNRSNVLGAASASTITVNAYGTINSGSSLNLGGNPPGGIEAGYTGATNGTNANTAVNGTVVVNNHANITALAGHGINAYNYGNGDVTVISFAGTTISVSGSESVGINAAALSGGIGDVTVVLGQNVTISGATSYGIRAYSIDAGDISVTMANGDSITSGSTGIVAVNYATAVAAGIGSTISVEAHGTIHSGSTSNNDGTIPGGIIAGYKPGGTGVFSSAVKGDVTVTSDATIIADAGYGIEAFTWAAGNITVTTGATSSIAAAGTAIGAFDHGGGDVSVTNNGSATGAVGVSAIANGSGDVTIVNHGAITSTSLAGISVTQNEVGATGSTHIINTGSIVAPSAHAAIFIQENATGIAQIDNSASGTIGSAVASTVTAATYAIVETGGAITINNAGHINGNISVATATFNNELGGTWTVAGTGVFGNASSIVNHGAIDLHGASISGTGLSVENCATIDSWGTASITGTIANAGSIEVHNGALTLFGSLSGAGSVTVDVGAWLKLEGTVTATQTITLDGDGAHLQIDASTFGGSIAALSANDTIDLSTIKYGLGTSAVYVANSNPATGGVLTVTDADGNHISLDLAGADYSNAHFAGSDDGTGHTLITMTDDHAPAFTAGGVLAGGVSEQADATGDFATSDTSTSATGAIDFTDIDLTDLPTAQITGQVVTSLGADHSTNLTSSLTLDEIAALKSGLTLLPQAGLNNGTVTWSYSIADGALDFLAKDQTAKVVSTITITDDYGETATTDVTITVTGKNDAPTLAAVTTDPLVDTAIADSFSDITGTLVGTDADHGETAGLTYAVLNADSHGTTAGLYGSLTVNENGTYTYVPDAASINALSEGNHIDTFTVKTTDAQGAVGTATFEVNVTGANDAPVITAASGDSAVATVSETDAGLDKTGTLTLSDLDTADHVSVARNDHVDVYLQGDLKADGFEGLWASDLLNYFTVPSGEILNGTANHAQFTWEFNSGSHAFDFLAAGQTLSLQYTIVPSDGHTATGTGNGVVTININGTNDAPTLDSTTLASVTGNESNPGGATIVSLFTDKFHDVDTGASFTAVAVTSDTASAAQGVWQYELHGTDQWVDIGLVSDTSALVLSTDTLIRFVPADGFTGTPDALGVHALDDTYIGAITDSSSPATIDLTATGTGGTTPVSHDLTTIDTEVTAPPDNGPVINTDHFQVSHSNELNTDSITGLSVVDTDSGAATDDFKMTAVTGHDPDSSVDPGAACGNLDDINSALADGVTYIPGATPPATDQITLTVTDKTTGLFDTVHFIFNEAGDTSQGVSLQGTSGKDVIFGTDTNDTLTGGDAKDQFVFAPGVLYDENGQPVTDFSHTITDFTEGLDKIDLRQFSGVSSVNNLTIIQQQDSDDTLVTWQQQVNPLEGALITEHESLLLKSVIAANLKGSDFIFHIT